MPTETLLGALIGLLLGLGIGGGLAWYIGSSNEKAARQSTLELERDLASSEAKVEMLDEQLRHTSSHRDRLLAAMSKHERDYATVSTRLAESQKNLADQKLVFEQSKAKLSESFQVLAAQALARNNQGILVLAEQKFKALKDEASIDLDVRKVAIETMVKPVGETLKAYQQVTKELEEKRQKEMGAIGEQLRTVASTQSLLQTETSRLVNALKSPQIRGRWGEIALRRTAELAGMTSYCDFVEQESVLTDSGRYRPDMVVKLPAGRDVVVDSKVPLGGFMEALEAQTDELKALAWIKHAKQVATHVDKLSAKEYWTQFSTSPEYVVLFIPNDSFLAAAAESDPDLVENALRKKIVLATPTTFVALLRVIEFGWQQRLALENAQEIRNLGQELSDRFSMLVEHLIKVGSSLGKAVDQYNSTVASFEHRILPTARRFKSLGAGGRKTIEELEAVDARPREMALIDGEDLGGQIEADN